MDIKFIDNDYQFTCRTSAVIYNKDKTKVLLFNVNGRPFYILPGGKVHEQEESLHAIKREIEEELGYSNIEFNLFAISEEFVEENNNKNHQINIIYQGIYNEDIKKNKFKGLEGNWCSFKWFDIETIDNIELFPSELKKTIKNPNKTYHFIERITK